MTAFLYLVLLGIILSEIVWRYVRSFSPHLKYVWVAMGAAWSAMLAGRFHEEPGFQWQELAYAFFSVFLFMALQAGYEKLRKR